jgi:hypothetical protein
MPRGIGIIKECQLFKASPIHLKNRIFEPMLAI